MSNCKKVPLILQTDIGGDIDDFWALTMILKQPQLDLQFVLTDTDNTVYRAAIVAKQLAAAGRSDIEIGAGIVEWPERHILTHKEWIEKYQLPKEYANYSQYGVDRLIERVKAAEEPITLVAIGPAPSLAAALQKAPEIAEKIDFVGMFGSIYKEHHNKPGKIAEYNVWRDIPAAQVVFSANWHSAAITPLDTCGRIVLTGDLYKRIEDSDDSLVKNIAEVYHFWLKSFKDPNWSTPIQSSTLYDTVAVHMASSREFLKMVPMNLVIDDQGFVQESPDGKPFQVAIDWTDQDAYCKFLVDTLTGEKA